MSAGSTVRTVPIGAGVFAKDGAMLGTVAGVRGRFFEVVGWRRYWLPLAVVRPDPLPGESPEVADNTVILTIGHNGLGDYQVPDAQVA